MKNFWNNKRVLVTGGLGFIGSHLVEKLLSLHANITILDHVKEYKLRNIKEFYKEVKIINGDCNNFEHVFSALKGQEILMNLAAHVGGIEYNRTHQGSIMRKNLEILTTIVEAARKSSVERLLLVSSACVYPHDAIIPTPEEEGFRDEPEPTNGGYGWAKRMGEILGRYYAEEFHMNISIVRPYNAYGPRDHFDSDRSHVIPALIRRIFSGENPLIVWGSGTQSRSFIYVEDLVDGMIAAVEKYPFPDPINLGSDEEISIRDLVYKIVALSGMNLRIEFDSTKPDGSPRRKSNNEKAKRLLGFVSKTSLDDGLKKTIEWYRENNAHS